PTVYAHFPDARSLLLACSGHVAEAAPPPDPADWAGVTDPVERMRSALGAVYRYYTQHEQLLDNVQRDAAVMPILAEVSAFRSRYLVQLQDVLLPGWPARGPARARLRRSIGHALEFRTWQSLVRRQGCSRAEAIDLMVALAVTAASG